MVCATVGHHKSDIYTLFSVKNALKVCHHQIQVSQIKFGSFEG